MSALRICAALLLSACAGTAGAHPLAPALLDLHELAPQTWSVVWRTSISRAANIDVAPVLPARCTPVGPVVQALEAGEALVERWTVRCAEPGLTGQSLGVNGIERSRINVIVRVQDRQGRVVEGLLDAAHPAFVVPTAPTAPHVFGSYLQLGVEHLLTGLDHVLFVAGLFLLVQRRRALVVTLTAFTAGHSLTLGLASLGIVSVSQPLAETGIALSILWLACELARPAGAQPSAAARRPWLMAAGFGLLHGLGFAGALAQVGLPQGEIPLALLAFNLGIEMGQLLLVVALGATALAWRRALPAGVRQLTHALPAYTIGALAAYWCMARGLMWPTS